MRNGASEALILNKKCIGWVIFFFLGLDRYELYLPALALYFLLLNPQGEISKVKIYYLMSLFLLAGSVLTFFVIGYERLELESPFAQSTKILISIVLGGWVFQRYQADDASIFLQLFLAGMLVESIVISIFSYLVDPLLYGYGTLLHPFTGNEINSPSVSNNLALGSVLLVYHAVFGNRKILCLTLLTLCVVISVFLGGRSFYLVILITAWLFCYKRYGFFGAVTWSFVFAFFIIFIMWAWWDAFTGIPEGRLLVSRFESGLESKRFEHLSSGSQQLILHPFGGFQVDQGIEKTRWFHNIFLDVARVGGWIPLLLLLLFYLVVGVGALRCRSRINSLEFVVFIVAFLLSFQDVIFEGNFRVILASFFASLLILSRYSTFIRKKGRLPFYWCFRTGF